MTNKTPNDKSPIKASNTKKHRKIIDPDGLKRREGDGEAFNFKGNWCSGFWRTIGGNIIISMACLDPGNIAADISIAGNSG